MAQIIKHRAVIEDSWRLLEQGPTGALPFSGDVIVPLDLWTSERDALSFRLGRVGVWLETDADPAAIAPDLARFDVIAVRFASFSDGRGYSLARLLRERYSYRGELRAIGDVLRDQLFYLSRCGFDAFALRADQDLPQALSAFDDFSEAYQVSVERPEPLFRRRLELAPQGKAA
ncbi:MAG TPA: DUF934 domain-containing protein [Burkholderiales bacterium]